MLATGAIVRRLPVFGSVRRRDGSDSVRLSALAGNPDSARLENSTTGGISYAFPPVFPIGLLIRHWTVGEMEMGQSARRAAH